MSKNGNLILQLKPGERVFIGDNVEIFVQKFVNGKVALGFLAPKHISILRDSAIVRCPKTQVDSED